MLAEQHDHQDHGQHDLGDVAAEADPWCFRNRWEVVGVHASGEMVSSGEPEPLDRRNTRVTQNPAWMAAVIAPTDHLDHGCSERRVVTGHDTDQRQRRQRRNGDDEHQAEHPHVVGEQRRADQGPISSVAGGRVRRRTESDRGVLSLLPSRQSFGNGAESRVDGALARREPAYDVMHVAIGPSVVIGPSCVVRSTAETSSGPLGPQPGQDSSALRSAPVELARTCIVGVPLAVEGTLRLQASERVERVGIDVQAASRASRATSSRRRACATPTSRRAPPSPAQLLAVERQWIVSVHDSHGAV